MQYSLTTDTQIAAGAVSVGVSAQETGLKEEHRGVPDLRGSAEKGQDHLGEHRLHGEQ